MTANIIAFAEVRRVLEERFPSQAPRCERAWEAEWESLTGAISFRAVTEVCSEEASGRLFVDRVLATARRRGEWIGVVEAGRSFDFHSVRGEGWEKVVVVCARDAEQAVKAADLLVRDGNVPLVLLDLQTAPRRALGRVPASTWHRFQRLVKASGTALVVLTLQPMVEAARVRITLRGRWSLAAMKRPRRELSEELDVQVFRRGRGAMPEGEQISQTA